LSIIYDVVKNPPIITIISPTANPYNSSNCVADITAKIENINGLENITILENGKPLESDFYTWNAGNKQLRIQQDVQSISNFKITATNKDGSDSKTVTIKCARP
jgi:copper chaperone CopZ